MIPEDKQPIFNLVKETLKFDYFTTEDQLLLRIYGQNEFIEHAVQEGSKLVSLFQTEEFSFLARAKLESKSGFDDLIVSKHEPIPNVINRGLKVSADVQINAEFVEAARTFFFNLLDKKIAQNVNNHKVRTMKELAILVLLQQVKLVLNFSVFQEFC